MAWLTALLFLALAATCKTLDLGDENRCPCKKVHTIDDINKWLVYQNKDGETKIHSNFGIGCSRHTIDPELAPRFYHEVGGQLQCYDAPKDPKARDPWCDSKWCYVDENKTCTLDWKYGRLGKHSYATCGYVRLGLHERAIQSFAASLGDDPLRVLHLESTFDGGYMGNSHCKEDPSASGASRVLCSHSLLAAFWRRSLTELEKFQVRVEPVLIKNSDRIDDLFNNIKPFFDQQMLFPASATNFDLCAFATGLGWVDLCSGAVALTPDRQEVAYLFQLYTAPAFMVSESTCILARPWWWIQVFSWQAWVFFVAVVFTFTMLMNVFDDDFRRDCIEHIPGACTWEACRRGCAFAASSLFTCVLGIGEAFIHQEAQSINHAEGADLPNTVEREKSRASWCVRRGLSLFIFVTTALYASSLTSELIAGRENGQYPSLAHAEKSISGVTLCFHQVYRSRMKPYDSPSSNIKLVTFTDWEKLKKGLENGTCHAAIVEEEAWKTWRARGELCAFYKSPTPTFHMPTGATASRRAYTTLETFRFSPSEVTAFELESDQETKMEDKFQDRCSMGSSASCKTTSASWNAFQTPALVATVYCLIGLFVLVYQKCRPDKAETDPYTGEGAKAGPSTEGQRRPLSESSGTGTVTTGGNSGGTASQVYQNCHRATEARGLGADLEAGRTEAGRTDAEAGPEQLEQPGRPQPDFENPSEGPNEPSGGSTETTTTGWNSDASQLWQL